MPEIYSGGYIPFSKKMNNIATNVYAIHGVIENYSHNALTSRHYIDAAIFEEFLRRRADKFVVWNGANSGGDILTVDDATAAGALACKLARKFNHNVIFFINPFQIIRQIPYYFSLINVALDNRVINSIVFGGTDYDLSVYQELLSFRYAIKRHSMTMQPEKAMKFISELADVLKSDIRNIPEHLQPITIATLTELHDLGVSIQSHGWAHQEISVMSTNEILLDIEKTRSWIQYLTGVSPNLYATPFGASQLPVHAKTSIQYYFLANPKMTVGELSNHCWNRKQITFELQGLFPNTA